MKRTEKKKQPTDGAERIDRWIDGWKQNRDWGAGEL
jgi:hypothetical protein